MAVHRIDASRGAESVRHAGDADRASALERLADLAIGLALGFSLEADAGPAHEPVEPDNAYQRLELAQLRRRLAELVEQLPEAERLVMARHYFQQQPFDEIARGQGLSKGRVSQIHHAALRRLRERLRESPSCAVL